MSNKHVLRSVAMAAQIMIDQPFRYNYPHYRYPVLSAEEYNKELKRIVALRETAKNDI